MGDYSRSVQLSLLLNVMFLAGDPAVLLGGVRVHISRLHQRRVSGDTDVSSSKHIDVLYVHFIFDPESYFPICTIDIFCLFVFVT